MSRPLEKMLRRMTEPNAQFRVYASEVLQDKYWAWADKESASVPSMPASGHGEQAQKKELKFAAGGGQVRKPKRESSAIVDQENAPHSAAKEATPGPSAESTPPPVPVEQRRGHAKAASTSRARIGQTSPSSLNSNASEAADKENVRVSSRAKQRSQEKEKERKNTHERSSSLASMKEKDCEYSPILPSLLFSRWEWVAIKDQWAIASRDLPPRASRARV